MNIEKTHWGLTETVPALPTRWYYDPQHYARELTAIWQRQWLYVCHGSEVAAPLSFRTLEVGDQNIVVLRDDHGELRAFHNSCRHRGSVLCTERQGSLKTKLLVCPYHQWSYAADSGRLVRTTSMAEPENFDKSRYGLFAVGVAEWRGCIFIHFDAKAEFGSHVFGRSSERIANYPLEDMVVAHTWRKVMACNWKVFWENFNECLHCPNVHPELSALVPVYSRRISNPREALGWEDTIDDPDPKYRGGLRAGAETWSSDGSAQNHVMPSLTEEDLAAGQKYVSAYPGVFFGVYADHVRAVRILPAGPEQTEIVAEWLLPNVAATDPAYDRSKIVDFAILVMNQDAAASELNQKGLHAAPLESGVLMPEEHWVKQFHDWVRGALAQASP
jgi:Rieske 2Fe-2S family protein